MSGRLGRRAVLQHAAVSGLAAGAGAIAGVGVSRATVPTGPHNTLAAGVGGWTGVGPQAIGVTWRVDTASRVLALTVDDGPDPRWTPRVLDLLGEYGARATFFVCGRAAVRYPDLVRAAATVGEVGNHSFTHPDLSRLPLSKVAEEVDRTHVVLAEILSAPPNLFRPPYGNVSGPVLCAAARHGYRVVLWTDHLRDAGTTVTQDVDRLVANAAPGRIILGHDGRGDRSGDVARLGGVLRRLTAEGYTTVSFTGLNAAARA